MTRNRRNHKSQKPWYERMAEGKPRVSTEAFNVFFQGEWQRRLDRVTIPDMRDASWDRKAAYLLWKAEKHDRD